jgi:hypothetical protein
MTLGTASFLSVVLLLIVFHAQFRKVFLRFAGIAVVLVGVSCAGYYLYNSYEAHVAAKNAPIDLSAGLVPKQDVDFSDLGGTRISPVIEIHGGETLKVIHGSSEPQHLRGGGETLFDMSKSIPIIYFGHHQTIAVVCGNFGDASFQVPARTDNSGEITCP